MSIEELRIELDETLAYLRDFGHILSRGAVSNLDGHARDLAVQIAQYEADEDETSVLLCQDADTVEDPDLDW